MRYLFLVAILLNIMTCSKNCLTKKQVKIDNKYPIFYITDELKALKVVYEKESNSALKKRYKKL
jgi:hypothetical protein